MTRNNTLSLRERREAAGLLQVELAALAGVGTATVNKAERWGFPLSPQTATKLAAVLKCDPAALQSKP